MSEDLTDDQDPSYAKAAELLSKIQALIGQVVIAWANLDNDLIFILSKLAGCGSYSAGIIFYALNSLNNQLSIIKGLAVHNLEDEELRKDLLESITRLSALSQTRNEFVHSVYSMNYNKLLKYDKWQVHKGTFRSERKTLIAVNRANTGEITDHLKLVGFLRISLSSLRPKLEQLKASPSDKIQEAQLQRSANLNQKLQAIGTEDFPPPESSGE